MMTIRQVTEAATDFFQDHEVPSARLNAELLLMFILGCDRAYLYAYPERELKPEEDARYRDVVRERASGCPTQYITGHQEFWGLDLIVSPSVLIPRPETEHVIETTLQLVKLRDPEKPLRIVDVGTGSGCIALALASELPKAEIHACDLSDPALEIARINAARLRLEQVQFRKSDLLGAYPGEHWDFVISNPPYVGESEADKVQKQVRDFEPRMAVFSGYEGLDIYKRLVPQAEISLNSGGWLVLEIGFSAEARVKDLLTGWTEIMTTADLQGIPRVVIAQKP